MLPADAVIGISCAVLVLLYVFQRLGTSKLGVVFAPVILLWFFSNFCIGIYNIVVWYPGVHLIAGDHTACAILGSKPAVCM